MSFATLQCLSGRVHSTGSTYSLSNTLLLSQINASTWLFQTRFLDVLRAARIINGFKFVCLFVFCLNFFWPVFNSLG